MSTSSKVRLVGLQVENIKRVKAVSLKFDREKGLFVIGGNNAEGKTSVIDSLEMSLSGGKSIPSMPIREGEDKARIVAETDNLIIERTFNKKNGDVSTALVVKGRDGRKFSSPQKLLDEMIGNLSFDPLAFTRTLPGEGNPDLLRRQCKTFKDLMGIDFDELDDKREKLYDERTDVNREAKRTTALIDEVPVHEDVPDEEIKVADLLTELTRREEVNQSNETARLNLKRNIKSRDNLVTDIAEIEKVLENMKADLKMKNTAIDIMQSDVDKLQDEDTDAVKKEIEDAEGINAKVREVQRRDALQKIIMEISQKSDELTEQIQKIDDKKARILSENQLPIEGVHFDGEKIFVNDIPIEQVNHADLMRLSVEMAIHQEPELRIMLLRDASHLDENSMEVIRQIAEEKDILIIMERVGEGDEMSVIIEDGRIKE